MRQTIGSNRRSAAGFISRDEGNVAVIFGLSFLPMLLMIGVAVDYSRAVATRSNLQQATDSAALAVASKMTSSTTVDQAKNQAQVLLNSTWRMSSAQVTSASISADKLTFCVNSQVQVPSSFMQLARINSLTPSAAACANLAGGVDPNSTFEIALVLDNSGSMSRSTDGTSKIQALKNAATSFVNTMYSKSSNVKFSIAPFAAGVVALDPTDSSNRNRPWIDTNGQSSQHWIAFGGKTAANTAGFTSRFDIFNKLKAIRSSWDWGGCLEPQTYPNNVNDTTPDAGDPDTLFVPYLAPDEPSSGWYNNSYLSDTSATCSGTVSGDWNLLTRVCKYNATSSSYGGSGPNNFCPSASTETVLQLTPTQSTITSKINNLVANGNTNLHEGFMWGWRTLSPNLPFAGGRSYNAPNNRKVMVFMTDGFNNWQSQPGTATGSTYQAAGYYSYNGAANARFPNGTTGNGVNYQNLLKAAGPSNNSDFHDTSRAMQDELTAEACANAKAQGIEIFTIGFSIPTDPIDTEGLNLLKACATNVDHYFAATDTASLNAAFSTIGIGLGKLRLSR